MSRVWNFSAGPGNLPVDVLTTAAQEMLNWHGCGMGVMEMSHRGKAYESIIAKAEADLRAILKVPANYRVLFLQGGAYGMFSAVPMNLLKGATKAAYIVTGTWSEAAAKEAKKYVKDVHIVCNGAAGKFTDIPPMSQWVFPPECAYIHYTTNETIHGVEFQDVPAFPAGSVVVADMSSDFLSRPIDVSKFGVIYAGAQKNMGPAGLAVVIVRDDLLTRALDICPEVWNWKKQNDSQSMFNTPNCWAIYMCGLVYAWILKLGGLDAMRALNLAKQQLLYGAIDGSAGYYRAPVVPAARSWMNVPFRIFVDGKPQEKLEDMFVKEAEKAGLSTLKGHRSVGGLRASLYNAMPLEGAQALVTFMADFQKRYPTAPPPPPAVPAAAPAAPKAA